jgi:hypothetical protein
MAPLLALRANPFVAIEHFHTLSDQGDSITWQGGGVDPLQAAITICHRQPTSFNVGGLLMGLQGHLAIIGPTERATYKYLHRIATLRLCGIHAGIYHKKGVYQNDQPRHNVSVTRQSSIAFL